MARNTRSISTAQLTSAQERFIQTWGQMGPSWGISRTMAEVHALLYIGGQPLNTDEVMERLSISRGNASMSLRSLVEWSLVTRVHKRGDRKEYFEADRDAWSMARTIIRERLRREILPLLTTLYDIREETGERIVEAAAAGLAPAAPSDALAEHNRRLDALVELIQTIDKLGERFVGSEGKGGGGLKLAATVLSKVV